MQGYDNDLIVESFIPVGSSMCTYRLAYRMHN